MLFFFNESFFSHADRNDALPHDGEGGEPLHPGEEDQHPQEVVQLVPPGGDDDEQQNPAHADARQPHPHHQEFVLLGAGDQQQLVHPGDGNNDEYQRDPDQADGWLPDPEQQHVLLGADDANDVDGRDPGQADGIFFGENFDGYEDYGK